MRLPRHKILRGVTACPAKYSGKECLRGGGRQSTTGYSENVVVAETSYQTLTVL